MEKYTFINNRLKHTPYNHACCIKSNYDITVRIIIFDDLKIVYLRINDLSLYQGLEYKRINYTFNNNLRTCEAYLKRNYKRYKIYNSYSFDRLPLQLQKDISNS